MIYGLKGWYWQMPNGKIGVVSNKAEITSYVDQSLEPEVCKLLQVDLGLQEELKEYHDSKWSQSPKTAPLSPRRYTGKLKLKSCYDT